jgi:hypothetical protein
MRDKHERRPEFPLRSEGLSTRRVKSLGLECAAYCERVTPKRIGCLARISLPRVLSTQDAARYGIPAPISANKWRTSGLVRRGMISRGLELQRLIDVRLAGVAFAALAERRPDRPGPIV